MLAQRARLGGLFFYCLLRYTAAMKTPDLQKVKKVFFLGIGGIGVSALARMMLMQDKEVVGSDREDSEIISELKGLGAKIFIGQGVGFIPSDTDLVIYTIAISYFDPELISSLNERGLAMLSYPEALGEISKSRFTIAVSGTHGKTTTTAMISRILIEAGLKPTVIVGSILKDLETNFISGESNFLVVEACEYRRSFLNLHPDILVITNIDEDHLDYYKDVNDIEKAFLDFVGQVKKSGAVVYNASDFHSQRVMRGKRLKKIDYSSLKTDFTLEISGAHNVLNAKAALSVAGLLSLSPSNSRAALKNFSLPWRRFEYRGETSSGAVVYDDYAHHPREAAATLEAARERHPDSKIFVVFQPHLYSRTKALLNQFPMGFRSADRVIIAPIYAAREIPDPSISHKLLSETIAKSGVSSRPFTSLASIEKYLRRELRLGDVLITMGAGDIYKLADRLLGVNVAR